jgi:hypothetical protein
METVTTEAQPERRWVERLRKRVDQPGWVEMVDQLEWDGRLLDELIANRVFGLVRCEADHEDIPYCYADPETPTAGGELPEYSSTALGSARVLSRMTETLGYDVVIRTEHDEAGELTTAVWFYGNDIGDIDTAGWLQVPTYPSFPESVCRAALMAVLGMVAR